MKYSIAWRLGLILATVGVLASGLTGYYAYHASRDLLVKAAEERLLTATRVLQRQVTVAINGTAADVRLLADHPQAERILRRSLPQTQAFSETNVAVLFERLLMTRPEYFQARLIDAAEHGLERIRVDRDNHGLIRVEGDDLQEKGQYPYVFETLRLPPGAVFVSRATINHEVGAHAGQGKPALQVAAPVHGANRDAAMRSGKPAAGAIVINVDLEGLFAQLAADLPPGLALYLSNGTGEFLIHPDHDRAFAFDRGQRAVVQEEFPAAAGLLETASPRGEAVVTAGIQPPGAHEPLVAAFVRLSLRGLDAEDEFILGLAQPLSTVVADSDRLGTVTLRIVTGLSVLAILFAALLARTLSRPLRQIVDEVRHFAAGEPGGRLPLSRQDEIGVLARSVADMQTQIRSQMDNLRSQQEALDRLARHDPLTGLPNRRAFMARIEDEHERIRRYDLPPSSVLMLDIDHFKQINDNHGHAGGDAVLTHFGALLAAALRKVDFAGRIGGEEFAVLLPATDAQAATVFAERLRTQSAEATVNRDGKTLRMTVSIGISILCAEDEHHDAAMARADNALYQAKHAGRNRVVIHSDNTG